MARTPESLFIDQDLAGLRLDQALAKHPLVSSRTRAQQLIHSGAVTLNGKETKSSQETKLNDIYLIALPEVEPTNLQPLDLKLEILFEDADLIVLNKPSGLVMHPAVGHAQDTLVNALLNYTEDLSMGFNEKRPGIVHRLDRDTSGVLVVARNDEAHLSLSQQFKDRTTHRIYWAILVGVPPKLSGRIESLLQRDPRDRKRFASSKTSGKWAATNYKVLETSAKGCALAELKLETGRTHQIRVHMSDLGTPVLGDPLYGPNSRRRLSKEINQLVEDVNRFALHATELSFSHPKTGEWMQFKVSWPEELKPLLKHFGFKTC